MNSEALESLINAVWALGWRNKDPQFPRAGEWHTSECWAGIDAGEECDDGCAAVQEAMKPFGVVPKLPKEAP